MSHSRASGRGTIRGCVARTIIARIDRHIEVANSHMATGNEYMAVGNELMRDVREELRLAPVGSASARVRRPSVSSASSPS